LSFGAEYFVFQFAIQKFKIYRTIILLVVVQRCETWSLTGLWCGNLSEKGNWEDQSIDGRIIFRSSGNGMWGHGLDQAGSR